jgi:hypothetical protein
MSMLQLWIRKKSGTIAEIVCFDILYRNFYINLYTSETKVLHVISFANIDSVTKYFYFLLGPTKLIIN